jgi:hypothetical protein
MKTAALPFLALTLLVPSVAAVAQGVPTAPTPVEKLPAGPERQGWEIVKSRHPHAALPGWTYMPGWSPPQGCIVGLPGPKYCFIRILPENGALSLDSAMASVDPKHGVFYSPQQGPRRLPVALHQKPRLSADQAWQRVLEALRRLDISVPEGFKPRSSPVLRVRDGEPLRLVYQFATDSPWRVNVDVRTGEVGGLELAYLGARAFGPPDPLVEFPSDTWVATQPPVR